LQIAQDALTYVTASHDQEAFTAKARGKRAERALY
jgi:hypothetical protein